MTYDEVIAALEALRDRFILERINKLGVTTDTGGGYFAIGKVNIKISEPVQVGPTSVKTMSREEAGKIMGKFSAKNSG